MKVYLVGGAVRDTLLGEPVSERDWVVVGETPDTLLNLGYQQVGRDFPVFLHPETKEEYALARTERKQGQGYRGFVCDAGPEVSLEDDLLRRDLTINAIAQDKSGTLIDPYHGARDIQDRVLRHVSPAFAEDPVRVLRLARFAARFHHFGFKVAEETRALVSLMVKQGELLHLVPERVWQEFQKALATESPEVFIDVLQTSSALLPIFPDLQKAPIQAMMDALRVVSKHVSKPVVRFAAFMRALSPSQIEAFCAHCRVPKDYRVLAMLAHEFCDLIVSEVEQDAEGMVQVLEKADAFRKIERFLDLLCACDARTITQQRWQDAVRVCEGIDVASLVREGYTGDAMKKAIHVRRVLVLQDHLKSG